MPAYLKAVPLPKTFQGFLNLNREEWLELLPLLILVSILFYLALSPIFSKLSHFKIFAFPSSPFVGLLFTKKKKRPHINTKVDKDKEKVATNFPIEDLEDKKVFCRCWKSNKVREREERQRAGKRMRLHLYLKNK